jgi:hypothetical protein
MSRTSEPAAAVAVVDEVLGSVDAADGAEGAPPVVRGERELSLEELWQFIYERLPEEVRAAPEGAQVAYFRRMYAAYQQRAKRDRASRDAAVFRLLDAYRAVRVPSPALPPAHLSRFRARFAWARAVAPSYGRVNHLLI